MEIPNDNPMRRLELYRQMLLIRLFEERLLELFSEGKLFGTTHTGIGQEATAVAAVAGLRDGDIIFSIHRCHGHYLARFDDPFGLLAEVMGREGGVCGGRGGSQNLCGNHFYTSGVQGGFMPIACGMALAEKRKGSDAIVVAFIGDGTLGEGLVYETFNLLSLWSVPMLVVIENNRYAQTTPVHLAVAGSMVARPIAFGLPAGEIESNDVELLQSRFARLIEQVRAGRSGHVEVVHTYRLAAHSKGDDYRSAEEIAAWRQRDPLEILGARLEPAARQKTEASVRKRLAEVEARATASPLASLEIGGDGTR